MGFFFCEQRLEENMKFLIYYWIFMIIFCVLNLMFFVLICFVNFIVISVLRKVLLVFLNLKILFLSFVVVDFVVGMCFQLMFGVIVVVMLYKNVNGDQFFDLCLISFILFYFFLFLLVFVLFLIILVIVVDRYLVVFFYF